MNLQNRYTNYLLLLLVTLPLSSQVMAGTNSCGPSDWTATSTETTSCTYLPYNPRKADIEGLFSSPEQVDEVTVYEDNNIDGKNTSLFTVQLDPNYQWGQIPNRGTWKINDPFWNIYENAAVSIKGGSSSAIFIVDQQTYATALWSIDGPAGTGGGLSNIRLWGVNKVPEPSVIALFSIGFAGLVFMRRRKK